MLKRREFLKFSPRASAPGDEYWLHVSRTAMDNPMYQAAYESIIKQGVLGEVYHARLAWHRNSTWRKNEEPPSPDFDPGKWGFDHIYSTFEYSGGRTATLSSIQSNAFEDAYEMFMGTKGTLILRHEVEAYLFGEGEGAATRVEVSRQSATPIVDASATRPVDSPGRAIDSGSGAQTDRGAAYRNESSEFCAAIRTGGHVRCGPEKAMRSAIACLTANKAAEQKARLVIAGE